MSNTENKAIKVLSITAGVLLLACIFLPKPVSGQESVSNGEYMVAVYPSNQGNDAVYVADIRQNMLAVFIYDNAAKGLQPVAMRPITDGFQQPGGARPRN